MLQDVVASPFYGLRGWMGWDVLLLTRSALYTTAKKHSALSRVAASAKQSPQLSAAGWRALAETRPRRAARSVLRTITP